MSPPIPVPAALVKACAVCALEFEQPVKRGALRKTCSVECTRERIRQRRRKNYAERYPALIAAGASYELAVWAARGGRVRFEAALAALRESPTEGRSNATRLMPASHGIQARLAKLPRWQPCPAEPEYDDDGPLYQGFLTAADGDWVRWEDIVREFKCT